MNRPSPPSFHRDLTLTPIGPDRFTIELPVWWNSLVGAHGGFTAAVNAAAMSTVIDAHDEGVARPLRSVTTQFVSAPRPGPAVVSVTLERVGRAVSYARATMHQDDKLRLLSTVVAGTERPGIEFDDRIRPDWYSPEPPDHAVAMTPPPEFEGHFPNAEMFVHPETPIFGATPAARIAGWLRPRGDEAVSALWLTCIADFYPPTLFARLDHAVAAASVDYCVHHLVSDPARHVGAGEWVYMDLTTHNAAGGYLSESGAIWAPDGTCLVATTQLRVAA